MSTLIIATDDFDAHAGAIFFHTTLIGEEIDTLHCESDEFERWLSLSSTSSVNYNNLIILAHEPNQDIIESLIHKIKSIPNGIETQYLLWMIAGGRSNIDSEKSGNLAQTLEDHLPQTLELDLNWDNASNTIAGLCLEQLNEQTQSQIPQLVRGAQFVAAWSSSNDYQNPQVEMGQLLADHFEEAQQLCRQIALPHDVSAQTYAAYNDFMRQVTYGLMNLSGMIAGEAAEKGCSHVLEHITLADADQLISKSLTYGLGSHYALDTDHISKLGRRQSLALIIANIYERVHSRQSDESNSQKFTFTDQLSREQKLAIHLHNGRNSDAETLPLSIRRHIRGAQSSEAIEVFFESPISIRLERNTDDVDVDLDLISRSLGGTGGTPRRARLQLPESKSPFCAEQEEDSVARQRKLGELLTNFIEFHTG